MSKLSDEMKSKLPEMDSASRLFTMTANLLRQNLRAEAGQLLELVMADARLLRAMIGEAAVRQAAEQYLHRVRIDMRGGATEKDDDGGQAAVDLHPINAPASSAKFPEKSQNCNETQKLVAQLRKPQEGESGQVNFEHHLPDAASPSPNASRGGQLNFDPQPGRAPSAGAPIPMPRRAPAAMQAIQGIVAKAIEFHLQDGRNIMDAQFHELRKIADTATKRARAWGREAIVARYLLDNCPVANPDPFDKVGAYFPVKTIELAIAEADKKETV